MTKDVGGRPRKIESPEALDALVDEYRGKCLSDNVPLTLTGMILHIGLSSRQSFDEYLNYDGFSDSVKRAKLMIECEYEQKLSGTTSTGSIFALKNFGWRDKQETELTGADGGAIKTDNTWTIKVV